MVKMIKKCKLWEIFSHAIICVSIVFFCIGNVNAEDPIRLKLSSVGNLNSATTQGYLKISEIVKRNSNGNLLIEVFTLGTLYPGETPATQAMLNHQLDISTSSDANLGPFTSILAPFTLPFLINGQKGIDKIIDSEYWGLVEKDLESKNIKIISVFKSNGGFRPIYTTKKAGLIKTPKDIKGKKIRTTNSAIEIETFKIWGASPVPMDWAEVYSALQQGILDGGNVMLTWPFAAKHFEVLKYINVLDYAGSIHLGLMALDRYNKIPEHLQKILIESGKEASKFQYDVDQKQLDEAIQSAKKLGLEIHYPTEAERREWVEASKPIYEKFSDKVKPELVELVKNAQK
jgi:TRAP-type transport system periplasmic protein